MDLKKLVKSATDKVSEMAQPKPATNPQEAAIAALTARDVKFEAKELDNTLFSAGGGYVDKVNGDDVRAARALFGHLKNLPPTEVVGYLTPDPTGTVTVVVNGTTVDRLTKQSAKLVLQKISTPTPVKIEVSIIGNRDPKFDRPHLKLKRDNKPPKP